MNKELYEFIEKRLDSLGAVYLITDQPDIRKSLLDRPELVIEEFPDSMIKVTRRENLG